MSSVITFSFDGIEKYQAMVENHRREGEERERRAIARWLRLQADRMGNIVLLGLASAVEDNEHDEDWAAALEHAGIDKDDA